MKDKSLALGVCSLYLMMASCIHPVEQPVDYVNPFWGTLGDHGQLFPGAVLPFGMVKLSPDTYPSGLNHKSHSGYNYTDEKIMGFSQVRLGGEGCDGAGGNISFLPLSTRTGIEPSEYAAVYDKKSEMTLPGYYHVRLKKPAVSCELTVTQHCGFQRYVFLKSDTARILLDLGRGFTQVRDAALTMVDNSRIEGYVTAGHLCGSQANYTVYFSTVFDQACTKFEIRQNGRPVPNAEQVRGGKIILLLDYDSNHRDEILFKTGLSSTGMEQARQNCLQEIPHWSFARVREQARSHWNKYLQSIKVEGSEENKQLFYTALYHSCQMPVQAMNADSSYRGTDDLVHKARDWNYYDSYSLWDTFRTKYPLLSLIQPLVLQDIVRSLVAVYEQGGEHWPFPTIRREHTVAVITDAYFKGLRSFDLEKAYQGMRRDAFEFRAEYSNAAAGVKTKMDDSALRQIYEQYDRLGYLPSRPDRTQENSYDSWCVAQMAKALGKEEDYRLFSRRANFYRNVWDPDIRFFRARDSKGCWLPFPDPRVIDETYVYEATMWQWRWFVLQDIPGLIELCGGKEKFLDDLNYFFDNDLYNHNNEQDLHVAFLFNQAGAPWLSQKWVHRILAQPMKQIYGSHGFYKVPYQGRIYRADPESYIPEMDDDCGTMSSWYVLASMGLYQVCIGDPTFQLTSPLFHRIEIFTDPTKRSKKSFIIEAKNLSEQNFYIQSAELNGRVYNKSRLHYEDLVAGGSLIYQMGSTPNKDWGRDPCF
jgi:predicted alpha-1,2-mannosidase